MPTLAWACCYIHGVYVQVGGSDQMNRAEREIAETLGERHRRRRPRDTFTIQNQEELIRSERESVVDWGV